MTDRIASDRPAPARAPTGDERAGAQSGAQSGAQAGAQSDAGDRARTGAEERLVEDRDVSVETFAGRGASGYASAFERLQKRELPLWHVNPWGLLVPWIWAAYRGVWMMFWIALAIDVFAVVCLMQVVKFAPLLAEARLEAAENVTLVERYSR